MQAERRTIIINADDYGCSPHIDRGIAQLIRRGHINSASVLVNGPHVQIAAQNIKKIMQEAPQFEREVSLGLHFNLTEGKPLTASILSSKLAQNGELVGKPKIFTIAEQLKASELSQIELELSAQVDRFVELFGRKPSHVDGHNHVHIIPALAEVIAKTMKKLGIYKTRMPLEKLQQITIQLNHDFLKFASISQPIYKRNGIISATSFVGLETFGKLSPELLRKALNAQSGIEGSVEMMCHPGFPAQEGSPWVKSQDRLAQMQQLEDLFQQFRGQGNYHDLRDLESSSPRVIICHRKTMKEQEQSNRIEEILMKDDLPAYFWTKSEEISKRISKLDFGLLTRAMRITHIVELFPSQSSEYIQQVAKYSNISYLSIEKQDQISQLLSGFLPVVPR